MTQKRTDGRGFSGFLQDVNMMVDNATEQQLSRRDFIMQIAERYANIRLDDIGRPLRFLIQLSGRPPVCFGAQGFRLAIVDDREPARHYTAFVFVGYWLPTFLAILVLWAWEMLGFVRYRGQWSQPDIRCGMLGIRHGRAVRKMDPSVLPQLVARDLSA